MVNRTIIAILAGAVMAVAFGAATGAAGGILIDGVIGAAIPKWRRLYS